MSEWTYLGDGLYARFDGYQVELRANDPRDPTSPTVYLDYAVYEQFVRFAEQPSVFDLE